MYNNQNMCCVRTSVQDEYKTLKKNTTPSLKQVDL